MIRISKELMISPPLMQDEYRNHMKVENVLN